MQIRDFEIIEQLARDYRPKEIILNPDDFDYLREVIRFAFQKDSFLVPELAVPYYQELARNNQMIYASVWGFSITLWRGSRLPEPSGILDCTQDKPQLREG